MSFELEPDAGGTESYTYERIYTLRKRYVKVAKPLLKDTVYPYPVATNIVETLKMGMVTLAKIAQWLSSDEDDTFFQRWIKAGLTGNWLKFWKENIEIFKEKTGW